MPRPDPPEPAPEASGQPGGPVESTVPAALDPARATVLVARGGPPSPRPPTPGRSSARFTEQSELGRGGMGRVALAQDHLLTRDVAIKHALSEDPGVLARFAREVRITARLEHPAIVPVHDAGHDEHGRPYYVMRRIEGVALDALVRQHRAPAERLALVPHVLAAADAAAYAHARGILHRDIKPTNILVGRYGETWLIDWGLARDLTEPLDSAEPLGQQAATEEPAEWGLTRAGERMGTPGFVAPEQARGEPVGQAADVYSLGATLAYVLTGRLLYPERAASGLWARAAANEPIDLGALAPEIPPALVAIVKAATAPRLEERYRDAAELAAELRRFLNGQLVAAHRYSWRERLRRFVRRHRAALAAGALALIAVAAVATASISRIVEERDRAARAERAATEQRLLAERRAEQLLLERARTQARREPTAALATLKLLAADSAAWSEAWGVATQAFLTGASRGLRSHRASVFALEFSPDGRRLASGGDDGLVQVHDLATLAAQPLAHEGARVSALTWLDDRWLAYTTPDALVSMDTRSGRQHRLPLPAESLHATADGSGLRFRSQGALYQLERELRDAPRVLVPAVRDALGQPAGTLVRTAESLLWVDREGRAKTLAPYREPYLIAAVSPDGDKLLLSDLTQVRELSLVEPGRQLASWPLAKILHVAYSRAGRCLTNSRESWLLAPNGDTAAHVTHDDQVRAMLARPGGCLLVEQEGTAVLTELTRVSKIPVRPRRVRQAATSPTGAAFAIAGDGGGLEVWPMDARPRLLSLEPLLAQTKSINPIGATPTALYFTDYDRLLELRRDTGVVSELAKLVLSAHVALVDAGAGRLVTYDPLLRKLVVLERANRPGARPLWSREQVPAAATTDPSGSTWIFARGTSLYRLDPHSLRSTELAVLAAAPSLVTAHGTLALAATERELIRLDLRSGARSTLPFSAPNTLALDREGISWAAGDLEVVRWDGQRRLPVEPLAEPITLLMPSPTMGMVARGRSGKLYVLDLQGRKLRELEAPRDAALSHVEPLAAWLDAPREQLHLLDLIGGEEISVPLTTRSAMLFLFDSEGRILALNLLQRLALELPSLPPTRPAALRAWLSTATNAAPTLTRSELRWSLPPLAEGPSDEP